MAAPLPLFSGTVRALLDHRPDMRVVGEVDNCGAVVGTAERLQPDIVLVDAGLPDVGGIEACAQVKATALAARVLVIGSGNDPGELVAAVEAGADGYLTVQSGVVDFLAAIRHLHRGEAWIPSAMLGSLLGELIRRRRAERAAAEQLARLSPREREVLDRLAEGLEPHEIAQMLFVSPHTVRTHVQNLLQKLDVHSRIDAVNLVLDLATGRPAPRTAER